jgi:hypothetical protein
MPLRDHFEPPLDRLPFEGVHSMWPTKMVENLFPQLPPNYFAAPQVHLGARLEYDVAAYELGDDARQAAAGGTATLAPPEPHLRLDTDIPAQDEYEVRVYDHDRDRRLVATVEIVSPSNKDRPENRRAFVAKCATLLQQGVCVSIVDIVTARHFNLYADLLDLIGRDDPAMGTPPAAAYAVTIRGDRRGRPHVKTWSHVLTVGQPLPTLPIGLADDVWVKLDLESTYEETCKFLGVSRLR